MKQFRRVIKKNLYLVMNQKEKLVSESSIHEKAHTRNTKKNSLNRMLCHKRELFPRDPDVKNQACSYGEI